MNFGWQVSAEDAHAIVGEAIDQGVTLLDTSVSYGRGTSETILGEVLHNMRRRQDVVIATKFGSMPTADARESDVGNSRRNVLSHCELSLRRLKTDYIDILQMHHHDEATPFEETLGALEELIEQGKVLRIGLCNLTGAQLSTAAKCVTERSRLTVLTHQVRYNLLDRSAEVETLSVASELNIANLAYAPLAEGFLSGKYRFGTPFPPGSRFALASPINKYDSRLDLTLDAKLKSIARCGRELGLSMSALALTWLAQRQSVQLIIVGPSTRSQVRDLASIQSGVIDIDTLLKLDAIVPTGATVA